MRCMQSDQKKSAFTSIYASIKPKLNASTNTIVLSIGGNDVKDSSSLNIALGVDNYINATMTPRFLQVYDQLIGTLKNHCDRIILISIYTPYMKTKLYKAHSKVAIPVVTKWRRHLEILAKKYNIPIIDLGRTIDNKNKTHYGMIETSLSVMASQCLALCIEYISDNYEGYKVYYAPHCDITHLTSD